MNKRIGQLAEKAGLLGPTSRVGNSHEATERFAKLVKDDYSKRHARLWLKRIDNAVKAEREEIEKRVMELDETLATRVNVINKAIRTGEKNER